MIEYDFEDVCAVCNGVFNQDEDPLVVPKAYVHAWCFDRDGRTMDQIKSSVPCCSARAALIQLGGRLFEERPGIPADQLWTPDKTVKPVRLKRFLITKQGSRVVEPLPDFVVPDKEA
jgi:hypothetical protein